MVIDNLWTVFRRKLQNHRVWKSLKFHRVCKNLCFQWTATLLYTDLLPNLLLSTFQTSKASSKLWPPISHSIEPLPHPVSLETNTTYRTIYWWTGYDVMLSNNLRGAIVIGLSKHIQFGSYFGMADEHPKHRKGNLQTLWIVVKWIIWDNLLLLCCFVIC